MLKPYLFLLDWQQKTLCPYPGMVAEGEMGERDKAEARVIQDPCQTLVYSDIKPIYLNVFVCLFGR